MYGENKKYPVPTVSAFIQNEKGEILFVRDSQGIWSLPGGAVNGGEDWVSALRKQVKKTAGLEVEACQLIGIYSEKNANALFKVSQWSAGIVGDANWFSPSKLPAPLLDGENTKIEDGARFISDVFVR